MDMNLRDQTPAGRIHAVIKLHITEDPLGSKHFMPGSYASEWNPPETGRSALLPFPGMGPYTNNPITQR